MDARQQLQDSAYSRLEVLLSAFGLLITLLVIVFGFRTEKAAARAAQGELADRQKELDKIMQQAHDAAAAAQRAADAAETASTAATSHAKSAADHAAMAKQGADAARAAVIPPSETSASLQEQAAALEEAEQKPKDQRTPPDYRALISAAIDSESWLDALKLAREMQIAGTEDKTDYFYALIQEAYAAGRLDRFELGVSNYEKVIETYKEDDPIELRRDVACAYFNRGLYQQIRMNDYTIIDDFETVIDRFSNDNDDYIRDIVETCHLQKAQACAEAEKVSSTIAALNEWETRRGGFDCAQITDNVFFEALLDRPQFAKYLAEKGCDIPTLKERK